MKTIIEPNNFIKSLWGQDKNRESSTYRALKYLIRAESEDGTLLFNNVTSQLVLLSEAEKTAFDNLPSSYENVLDELIDCGFVVSSKLDEQKRVLQIREVLNKIEERKKKSLNFFTILPTTACNARCFYCFEAGVETTTMTTETADQVVEYIYNNCNGKDVGIRWFGGEPTVGHKIIDRISAGLKERDVAYKSSMISNGYLFDADMVDRAVNLWNLTRIQITLDGTEEVYNKTKSYVNVKDNPYLRVLDNIGSLIENKILVTIRLNLDRYNSENLRQLIEDLYKRFGKSKYLVIYPWPVFGDCGYDPVKHDNNDNDWLRGELLEISNYIAGFDGEKHREIEPPKFKNRCCMGDNDSTIVIKPSGELTRCLERFEENEVVGNVFEGITNPALYEDWKTQLVPEICEDCSHLPNCVFLKHCMSYGLCYKKDVYSERYKDILSVYERKKGDKSEEI